MTRRHELHRPWGSFFSAPPSPPRCAYGQKPDAVRQSGRGALGALSGGLCISVALMLSACATTPTGVAISPRVDGSTATADSPRDGVELLFGALPDAKIPSGSCGMVLWTLSESQPTPIFRYLAGALGEAVIDQEPAAFSLVDASGANRYGVSSHQRFQSPDGKTAVIRVSFGLGFDGGVYIEDAVIALEDGSGWRAVTPAAGLAGCRR